MNMRALITSLVVSAFLPSAVLAQGGSSTAAGSSVQQTTQTQRVPDGFLKQDMRVILLRNGQMSALNEPLQLANGMRVDPDGTVTSPGGSQIKLQPNQMLTMNGMVIPRPANVPPPAPATGDGTQATKAGGEASAGVPRAGEGTGAK